MEFKNEEMIEITSNNCKEIISYFDGFDVAVNKFVNGTKQNPIEAKFEINGEGGISLIDENGTVLSKLPIGYRFKLLFAPMANVRLIAPWNKEEYYILPCCTITLSNK